ncbi:hypothetical protein BOO24_00230 [Vibrio navarrensis]|uniref:outer membrane beta-barrel protein n=1 Tax=Vibrio navarrensis TaxID=29495 RepID=UPI00186A056A|nr:outer membrane beta-barrel protein [Vibrio navarrensis]MBE4590784.1 hypothetical protein [Vibrio navarrensis]
MSYKYAFAGLLSVLSLAAHATPNKHVIGGSLGYGDVSYSTKVGDKDGDMFLGDIYYRYMFNEYFGIEPGLKGAFNGIGSTLISPISEVKDVSYGGERVSGYASYPLGAGFEIYGKGGLTYYTLSYTVKTSGQSKEYKESSLGGEAAAGVAWAYKHFGLNLEYNYAKNSDFSSGGVMFGAQVRF